MSNRIKVFLIVAGVVVIVAGVGAVARWWSLSGSVSDWWVSVEADTLVRFSDHIVIARYMDEEIHPIPDTSTAGATLPASLVVYRRFEVAETLKGSFARGDVAYLAWHVHYYKPRLKDEDPEFTPWEEISLSPGENYVLFLSRYHGRRAESMDVGIRLWRTPKGLEVAQTDSEGRLAFQTTRYYQAALEDMGLKPVPGTGGAPFELTVEEIEALVASQMNDPG